MIDNWLVISKVNWIKINNKFNAGINCFYKNYHVMSFINFLKKHINIEGTYVYFYEGPNTEIPDKNNSLHLNVKYFFFININ